MGVNPPPFPTHTLTHTLPKVLGKTPTDTSDRQKQYGPSSLFDLKSIILPILIMYYNITLNMYFNVTSQKHLDHSLVIPIE